MSAECEKHGTDLYYGPEFGQFGCTECDLERVITERDVAIARAEQMELMWKLASTEHACCHESAEAGWAQVAMLREALQKWNYEECGNHNPCWHGHCEACDDILLDVMALEPEAESGGTRDPADSPPAPHSPTPVAEGEY